MMSDSATAVKMVLLVAVKSDSNLAVLSEILLVD